jgi:hypothetical protein
MQTQYHQHEFNFDAPPLVVSYGGGVNSTAMLVGFHQRRIRPELIMMADPGNEKTQTYEYLPVINDWLASVGFPTVTIVRYEPKRCKHGSYRTLGENCLRNGTLPSLAFGRKACSMKWKVAPQNAFCASWEPARRAWAAGLRVRKAIGYDCGIKDSVRYADAGDRNDRKYEYIYPLRDWGWDRDPCITEIIKAGLPVPVKSACYFCPSTKPDELHSLEAWQLKSIVIMETRAKPRLHAVGGLWRRAVKGYRGAISKPAAMTDYIRARRLLPVDVIDRLSQTTPLGMGEDHWTLDQYLAAELGEANL